MKKTSKLNGLRLTKETVRPLNAERLRQAAGGTIGSFGGCGGPLDPDNDVVHSVDDCGGGTNQAKPTASKDTAC